MALNKKLIHFKNKEKFNEELANGNILDTSIVFILDSKEIYTHGQYYGNLSECLTKYPQEFTKEEKDQMLENLGYYFIEWDGESETIELSEEEYAKFSASTIPLLVTRIGVEVGVLYPSTFFPGFAVVFQMNTGDSSLIISINLMSPPVLEFVTSERTIPTHTSDLENDSNFISSDNLKTINGESLLGESNIIIPTKVSELENDSGFFTIEDSDSLIENVGDFITLEQLNTALLRKQNTLVSGSTIKTINGESILGEGNLTVNTEANIQAVDTTDEIEDVETNTYVKYVALTLTDELKALVRENIGALSASDLVTVDLSNYYTKEEINALLGDINTILESIIND